MLAHLVTEPELSTAGPLDDTLDVDVDEERIAAALAYDAAPHAPSPCWTPVRRGIRRRPDPHHHPRPPWRSLMTVTEGATTIALDAIDVPDNVRELDDAHAGALHDYQRRRPAWARSRSQLAAPCCAGRGTPVPPPRSPGASARRARRHRTARRSLRTPALTRGSSSWRASRTAPASSAGGVGSRDAKRFVWLGTTGA